MRNRNFSYHITGLVRKVYDMRNGQFSYNKRGTKHENFNKYIEMVILYFIQHFNKK